MIRNAAISGTGLIGASIGLGLSRAGWTVRGWDPDPEALNYAASCGAIAEAADSFEQLPADELAASFLADGIHLSESGERVLGRFLFSCLPEKAVL